MKDPDPKQRAVEEKILETEREVRFMYILDAVSLVAVAIFWIVMRLLKGSNTGFDIFVLLVFGGSMSGFVHCRATFSHIKTIKRLRALEESTQAKLNLPLKMDS